MCMELFNDIQLLANLDEGSDGAVKLFARVGSGKLDADACLSFRNHRIVETGDVDVLFLQFGSELL